MTGKSEFCRADWVSRCIRAASSGRSPAKKNADEFGGDRLLAVCVAVAIATDPCRADYERVRADVIAGLAGAEALGAIIFHGMRQGLRVLSTVTAEASEPVNI